MARLHEASMAVYRGMKLPADLRGTCAGSTRDQALYSAKLALISAILYVIAAIAM